MSGGGSSPPLPYGKKTLCSTPIVFTCTVHVARQRDEDCDLITLQILNVLTNEELALMLSDRLIIPRTFRLRRSQSLFVAGLGRIDYVSVSQLSRLLCQRDSTFAAAA